MLSSLGRLNADLLTMYYGHEPVPAPRVAAALREANALYRTAARNHQVASGQDRYDAEEHTMTDMAARSRHVARHTQQPNSMCVGPCVHIPRSAVKPIQQAAQGLYGSDRTGAVKRLTRQLAKLQPARDTEPRLCSTGVPCAAARFERSNDLANLRTPPNRQKLAAQVMKEATYTRKLANMMVTSRVRELEADDSQYLRLDLSGGGGVPESNQDNIRAFFRQHQLGDPPDTGDVRVALNHVVARIAPHAQKHVRRDLWARWMNV
jgi:hypothetical protein